MKAALKYIESILETAIWIPILFFSSLLIHNGLLYYRFDMDYGILPEKQEAMKDDLWLVCFYIHVVAGVVCLIIPVVNIIGRHLGLSLRWHQMLGKLFVNNNIMVVAPTGMYLATYAKGGIWAELGFICQGILLVYFSYVGMRAVKTSIFEHIKHMMRAYAVALSVLTFRILHVIFIIIKIPYQDNYAISQWLSITLNLAIVELIITYLMAKRKINVPLLKMNI